MVQNNTPQRSNHFTEYIDFNGSKMSWHVACIADVLVPGWNKSELVVEETLVTVGEFVQSRESVAEKTMTKG